jgi:hypothetical protein
MSISSAARPVSNPGPVKTLLKADRLRYHLPTPNGFPYVIRRNSGDSRDF